MFFRLASFFKAKLHAFAVIVKALLACLHVHNKWPFWLARFYPNNHSNLKRFQKPTLEKSHFAFGHVNRLRHLLVNPSIICF